MRTLKVVLMAMIAILFSGCAQFTHLKETIEEVIVSSFTPGCGNGRIWIDTDMVVDAQISADPDDGIAWEMIRDCPNMVGISTVEGNAPAEIVWRTVAARAGNTPLWRGEQEKGCSSSAVVGMAEALREERMVIVGLGPLTNVAAVIDCHPELTGRIEEVIAIGGRTSGTEFWLGEGGLAGRPMKDLNFELDPGSFRKVLDSGVYTRLFGFEAGEPVRLAYGELRQAGVDELLVSRVENWARTLYLVGGEGTIPSFDPVAVAGLLDPSLFDCMPVEARSEAGDLIVQLEEGSGGFTEWCLPRNPSAVRAHIRARLQKKTS